MTIAHGVGVGKSHYSFLTQKERDNESGLDYFLARHFSSAAGRFTSVDPALRSASQEYPQSWNRYGYVLNNPLILVDPTGETWLRRNSDGALFYTSERVDKRDGYTVLQDGETVYFNQGVGDHKGLTGHNVRLNANGRLTDLGAPQKDIVDPFANDYGARAVGAFVLTSLRLGVLAAGTGATGGFLLLAVGSELALDHQRYEEEQTAIASINADRQYARNEAWRRERAMVAETGQGTVDWTPQEREELLRTGRVSGYEGHHINDVNTHPGMARDPNNIKFVRGRAGNQAEHGGNFRNPTEGPLIERPAAPRVRK